MSAADCGICAGTRRAFEAWAATQQPPYQLHVRPEAQQRGPQNIYSNQRTQHTFEGFAAAQAAPATPAPAAPLNEPQRKNLELVIARLEQIVATEGEFADNLVDLAKDALPCARAVMEAPAAPQAVQAQVPVEALVNRFLGWSLPKDFSPDCGISFDGRKDDEWNKNKPWPIGTNLLGATQAKAMFEYCLKGAVRPTDDHLWNETIRDRDTYHEWADKLADAIAKHFGAEIGEHSNMNCPWAEALEVIECAAPSSTEARATAQELEGNEQYRMQMAAISTASTGYWKEGDGIHVDYDTLALRDVAKLYAKYAALYAARATAAEDAARLYQARPRGIGLDWTPGCMCCGGEKGLHNNTSFFVPSRETGEAIVSLFNAGAFLDWRESEPNWIQVKVGACDAHLENLRALVEGVRIGPKQDGNPCISLNIIDAALRTTSPSQEPASGTAANQGEQ